MTEHQITVLVLLGLVLIGVTIMTIMEIQHRRKNKDRFKF